MRNYKFAVKGLNHFFRTTLLMLVCVVSLTGSSLIWNDYPEKVRVFTRKIEFDYVSWTFKAFWQKTLQQSVRIEDYLPSQSASRIVREYLKLQSQIAGLDSEITLIYSNPDSTIDISVLEEKEARLDQLHKMRSLISPIAESTIQKQIGEVLADNSLAVFGQSLPPVLYHSTPLPEALIVSPRGKIQQDANISLMTDMTSVDIQSLEDRLMNQLDVSALVVPVGGVGIYPTMVMATSDLSFLADTVAHEWTHNFLTLRPLGLNYETNSELRTINETAASIVGSEVGKLLLEKYYPDLLPQEFDTVDFDKPESDIEIQPLIENLNEFNYRKEMHLTRVRVDDLLAEGKILEAEEFMEQRRLLFWKNGYPIRRINQAYFAFYGAYADTPGGAAGKDPVGPTVRAFREQSKSLAEFLQNISWVTSYAQLVDMVKPVS